MYNKLTKKFKDRLADRAFDIKLNCISIIIFVLNTLAVIITWVLYKSELILGMIFLSFFIVDCFSAYLLVFVSIKQKSNLRSKDFFNMKKVFRGLKCLQEKDIDILQEILQEFRINTKPKKKEAIRHYQMLLLRKPQSGFAILSVISIVVSIFSILFTCIQNGTMNAMMLTIFLASSIVITALICFGIKCFYKSFIYGLTEYAIYERIESALSEIWMEK